MSIAFPDVDLYVWPWKLYLFIISMFLRQDDKDGLSPSELNLCSSFLLCATALMWSVWTNVEAWKPEQNIGCRPSYRPFCRPLCRPLWPKRVHRAGAYRTPPGKWREKQTGSLVSTMGSKHSGLARRYLEKGFGGESMHHYGVVTACEQRVPPEKYEERAARDWHTCTLYQRSYPPTHLRMVSRCTG